MKKSMKWIKNLNREYNRTTDDWLKPIILNPIPSISWVKFTLLNWSARAETTNNQVKPRIMNPITSTIRKKSRLLNRIAKQRQKMSGVQPKFYLMNWSVKSYTTKVNHTTERQIDQSNQQKKKPRLIPWERNETGRGTPTGPDHKGNRSKSTKQKCKNMKSTRE